jgi:hypothetical protein
VHRINAPTHLTLDGKLTLTGGLLLPVATMFHPPLTDPWAGELALEAVSKSLNWTGVHLLFGFGLTLWLLGLSHCEQKICRPPAATPLWIVALGMWYLILVAELAVMPPLLTALTTFSDPIGRASLQPLWDAWFAFSLTGGYVAMGLVWLGVILGSLRTLGAENRPGWWLHWGWLSGVCGIIGLIGALLVPEQAVILLLVTSLPPYLWTLVFPFQL